MPENQIPEQAKQLIDQIIAQSEIEGLDSQVREQLEQDLYAELDAHMLAAAIDNLPDEQLDTYQQMVTSDVSSEEMQKFFAQHIENLEQVLTQAVIEFKSLYTPTEEK